MPLSRESFEQHDGDVIFLLTGKTAQQLSLDEFVKDPLFSQLSAVKKGQIYEVSSDAWSAGRNILAAHRVLDDIVRVR
ncbi:MAG: ABC transporter substrate-binding protein [Acaryochloridaceae cyanobacterium CSU_3_4]|nr:ABC transporter substrate-binding protein [Acaryochloridaceae cyanobacterium CSU_3_4]